MSSHRPSSDGAACSTGSMSVAGSGCPTGASLITATTKPPLPSSSALHFLSPLTTAQFRVTTPTQWKTDSFSSAQGTTFRLSDTPGDYEFSVTKTPQPASALDSYEQGLNRATGQLAADAGAEIVEQTKPIVLNDLVFKRFVYRKGDTYWRGQFELLKDRLYVLLVKAPNSDPAPYLHMVDTFQILGPR